METAVEAPVIKPVRGRPPKDPDKLAKYVAEKMKYEEYVKSIGGAVKAPSVHSQAVQIIAPPETEETDAERVLRISTRFDIMWKYTMAVANGKCRSFICSGAPGVGKSYTIEHILSQKKDKGDINYRVISGAVTGIELYKAMYKGRDKDYVLVIDDADGIFGDDNGVSILKGGLDSKPKRHISWLSNSGALKGIPEMFEYEGRMIFITNLSFDMYKSGKLAAHMKAFKDRSVYLDLSLHTKRDIMAWCANLILKNHILVQHSLNHEQEKMIVEWMREHRDQFISLSLRTAEQLARHYKLFGSAWEASAKQLFLQPE
jgi:hypothetical protein